MTDWTRSQTMELDHWTRCMTEPPDLRGAVLASAHIWNRFGVQPHHWVGKTIVDVGCGPTARCACFGGANVIAIDPLADEYQRLPGAIMEWYSKTYAKKAEEIVRELVGQADVVVSINCLDHCEHPTKVLRNMFRYCKQDGIGFVSVDCSDTTEEMHPSRMSAIKLAGAIRCSGWIIERSMVGQCYPRCHEDGSETWDDGWSPNVVAVHWWLRRP